MKMPSQIRIDATNTGFFALTIDGKHVGTYGNPAKALNEATLAIGYTNDPHPHSEQGHCEPCGADECCYK